MSVEEPLLVRYVISGIAISRLVKYQRLVAFIVYLKTTIIYDSSDNLHCTTVQLQYMYGLLPPYLFVN